jgi:uncharacterized protein YrzB (UPF0473 family)
MENEEKITLVDENGNEELYDILFTFESDDFNKSYIVICPTSKDDNDEVSIQAFALSEGDDPTNPQGGDLQPIESDEEWDMVESVLNTFIDSNED